MLHSLGARMRSWVSEPPIRWGAALAVFGFLERAWLWLVYQPIPYADTNSYMRLARVVSRLTLEGYDGTRVPGYPITLALVGMDPERAWLAQMTFGWVISMLLFWVTWRTSGSAVLGVIVGCLYDLIPGQLLFEANLLTETSTTFWIVLSLALLVALGRVRKLTAGIGLALVLGLVASIPGMFRPLFFPLTIWLLPFIWSMGGGGWRQRLIRIVAYSIGPLLIQGGWLLFIHNSFNMISPTTMGGFSLVQHTGEYFEYLPDEVASIRDTYLYYRDLHVAERGVQTNAIWDAIPAMSEATGLSFYGLSRELSRLSLQLIREHPGLYLRNVWEGWIGFWKAPVYWQPSVLSSSAARALINGLTLAGRIFSIAANALFIFLSVLAVVSSRGRTKMRIDRYAVVAAGLIWWTSVVQTLVDHGDNPRFLVPLQMVVIYGVMRAAWFWVHNKTSVEVGDK